MKRKYLTITYLHVLLPFKACSIKFLVKQPQTITVAPELPFISKPYSRQVSELITFEYDGKSQLMLFVLAVKTQERERVVSLGGARIDLKQDGEVKGVLEGVEGQKGYIVYKVDNLIKKIEKENDQEGKKQSIKSNGDKKFSENNEKIPEIEKIPDSNQQPAKNILKSSQNSISNHMQNTKVPPLLQQNEESVRQPSLTAPKFIVPIKIVMSQQKLSENEEIPSLDVQPPSPGVSISKMQADNKSMAVEQKAKAILSQESKQIQRQIMKHRLKNAGYRQVLLKNELFQQQYKALLPK